MAPVTQEKNASNIRKFHPRSKLPSAMVLSGLSDSDSRLLESRLREPIECVYDPRFDQKDAEQTFMGPLPDDGRKPRRRKDLSNDSGADWLSIPPGKAFTSAQEIHMFQRFNYCRWRTMTLLEDLAQPNRRLTATLAREILRWEHAALNARSEIVRVNVPLVLAMAKRTRIAGADYAELISEGNLALLRSVDKFDCSRGYKFSTYACRAILKSFSRVAARATRHRGRFPTEFDPALEKSDYLERKREDVEDYCLHELRGVLGNNSAELSDVEQTVIRARFALDEPESSNQKAKTLEQVGQMIGVTKERVRQIQNKALGKLRSALEDEVFTG